MAPLLSESDQCDACGSQAFVKATRDGQVLLFCGHHGRQHRAALIAQGWIITDELHRIEGDTRAAAHV
jgi:hypothetical protein